MGLAVAMATAWGGLRAGDPEAAPQSWEGIAQGRVEPASELAVDIAAFQRDVAPWQPGYRAARVRLQTISDARRQALPHDRGAHPTR